MDMDRTHPPKTNKEKENRQTQNYLEEINSQGSKETWNHLERDEESSK